MYTHVMEDAGTCNIFSHATPTPTRALAVIRGAIERAPGRAYAEEGHRTNRQGPRRAPARTGRAPALSLRQRRR